MKTFDVALSDYVAGVQTKVDAVYAVKLPGVKAPVVSADGQKFVRVVLDRNGVKTAHSFVNRETGDVLRAASWKYPSKKVYGSVYAPRPAAPAGILGVSDVRAKTLVVDGLVSPVA